MPRPVRLAAPAPREDEGEDQDVLAEPGSPIAPDAARGEPSSGRGRGSRGRGAPTVDRYGHVDGGVSSKRHSRMFNPLSLDLAALPSAAEASSSSPTTASHRRDKTKSTQSFIQPTRREQQYAPAVSTTRSARGATVAQRPAYGERTNSAPTIPKGTQEKLDEDDEEEDDDDEDDDEDLDDELVEIASAEDEDIAGDEFFQQYAAPGAEPDGTANETPGQSEDEDDEVGEGPLSPTSNTTRFRPDSVAEPLGSPLAPQPVTFAGRMHEINIAVLGSSGVGKSSFIQRVFDHRAPPTLTVTPRKMSIDGEEYTVRLIELPLEELDFDDESRIGWPTTADHRPFPPVDGVLTLYNVMDKDSLSLVPETLRAVYQSKLPFHLVACKCDNHPNLRQVDPLTVGQRAKALIGNVSTFETSQMQPGTQKRCLHTLLRVILNYRYDHQALATASARKRAASQIPVPQTAQKHNRASSELSGSLRRAQQYAMGAYDPPASPHPSRSKSAQRLPVPSAPASSSAAATAAAAAAVLSVPVPGPSTQANNALSNLNNATSYDTLKTNNTATSGQSGQSGRSAVSARSDPPLPTSNPTTNPTANTTLPERPSVDKGYTWDQLIARLLQQPLSKNDKKFVHIFLALYRTFAAPGQLLEAILRRFNEVSLNDAIPEMSRTVIQQRHLQVLELWISSYPGDFAHQATRASMCRFVALIANTRIFAITAREIAADLEVVVEDDDTLYACSDKHRARPDTTLSFMSEASTLHDENFEELIRDLSGMTFTGAMNQTAPIAPEDPTGVSRSPPSTAVSSSSTGQTKLAAVEAAAVSARTLRPSGRIGLTKVLWHALEDTPDDAIAKELTRMDWTMFMSIRPRDLVRHVSLNSEQKKNCRSLENVNRMISHFNHLAFWVANFVLLRDKPKHRAVMLEKFMRVARVLRQLNNYNSLGAVIAGINSTSVHRLTATRELINSFVVRDFMKLEILMGTQKSHFAYRLAWENSPGERIPYIPLHRRDLVTAIEGNKTWMEGGDKMDGPEGQPPIRRYVRDGDDRINWKKFEIMGEVVIGVQSAQSVPTPRLAKNDIVRESVLDVRLTKDEDELYARSVQLEPTGAGADKKKFANWFQRGASNAASMLTLPTAGAISYSNEPSGGR